MPLTDTAVRNAGPRDKDYAVADTDGLALFVTTTGSKIWHFRFSWAGKQPRISLGAYPEFSLKDARAQRDEARAMVERGVDPRVQRRQARQAAQRSAENTFDAVYKRWRAFKALSLEMSRQSTLSQITRIFAKDVLPRLGSLAVFDIARADLLEVLRKIEQRGALSTAEKCRTWFNQLFRYAIVEIGGIETNPAADLDIVAVPQPPVTHNPYLQLPQLPAFLCTLQRYRGDVQTRLGLRLLLLTGVRTGELRLAIPEQFDLERGIWTIPVTAVKQLQLRMRKEKKTAADIPPYIVPLSQQAIAIVKQLIALKRPVQRYLLSHRSDLAKRVSENTLNGALKRMGYQDQLTGHGMRATIDTALHELGYNHNWIESQLSHANSDPYNHAKYVEERRRMMQEWADRLDQWEQGDAQYDAEAVASKVAPGIKPNRPPGSYDVADRAVCEQTPCPVEPVPLPPPLFILARRDQRAQPVQTDVQRERAQMLATFELPHNLSLPVFAKLAGKSRHQINRDIRSRRLLALSFGNRGYRIPDWQLDPCQLQFTCAVWERMPHADAWALYRALSAPLSSLSSLRPVDAALDGDGRDAMNAVLASLAIGPGESDQAVSDRLGQELPGCETRAA